MNISDFMAAVGKLCTALDDQAPVIACNLTEGVVRIDAIVKQPDQRDTPADIRRGLYEGAERAIAIAEQHGEHSEPPVIYINHRHGDGYPTGDLVLTLRLKPKTAAASWPLDA